jgi:hypothetical protein
MTCVGLLFSHLPKQICGSDIPIRQLRTAMEFLRSRDVTIVTSVGQTHWDCILTASLDCNIPVHVVIVKPMTIDEVVDQFSCEIDSYDVVESWEERDKYICSAVECLYPLWLRRGGHFARMIPGLPTERLDFRFDCSSYRFRNSGLKYSLQPASEAIRNLPDNYLWHWTRGSNGLWAGETRRNYCNDIFDSQTPPRNGFATLCRILHERKIRASGLHIAGNIPVVSFSANHPAKSDSMFTWRTDWKRMNFEPYGIGIPKNHAHSKGVKPIKYGIIPDWDTMRLDNRWKNEHEWRVKDDFLLDSECMDKMVIAVRKPHEIEQIKSILKGTILATVVAYEK